MIGYINKSNKLIMVGYFIQFIFLVYRKETIGVFDKKKS